MVACQSFHALILSQSRDTNVCVNFSSKSDAIRTHDFTPTLVTTTLSFFRIIIEMNIVNNYYGSRRQYRQYLVKIGDVGVARVAAIVKQKIEDLCWRIAAQFGEQVVLIAVESANGRTKLLCKKCR